MKRKRKKGTMSPEELEAWYARGKEQVRKLRELAANATVPVINGLSDGGHPVQLLADLFTILERFRSLRGRTIAWVGDGASNMALSWIEASPIFGFTLRICAPEGFRPATGVEAPRIRSFTRYSENWRSSIS